MSRSVPNPKLTSISEVTSKEEHSAHSPVFGVPEESVQYLLAAIVESSDDAIVSKDLNGIVTSWNSAAERMFGYKPDEIIGQSILKIIPPELQYQETFILDKVRRAERIEHFETERVRKDGERIAVSLTISPVKDSHGRVVGVSKIARDVTQRKQIEAALVQSEKLAATGRMAATIAHEINNPLEAVVNLIYLARNEPSVERTVKEYLLTAEKEIERVSLIARQTLGFYREPTTPVPTAMHELVQDVLIVYQSRLRSRGIRVDTQLGPIRPLMARKGEVAQIVSNLVSNSIDAMPNGGSLRIQLKENSIDGAEGVEMVVQDRGSGIHTKDQERMFQPFFTTKKNVGTGLGLWIVKQFLDNHGGAIRVDSSTHAVDHGTTITIFLPFNNPIQAEVLQSASFENVLLPASGDRKC